VTFIDTVANCPCTSTEIDEAFTVTPDGDGVTVPTVTGPVAPPNPPCRQQARRNQKTRSETYSSITRGQGTLRRSTQTDR
jgi:hypothetical protein